MIKFNFDVIICDSKVVGGLDLSDNMFNNTHELDPNILIGNFLLFFNTIMVAIYYIYAKPILTNYPPMLVTAWAYVSAAFFMGITACLKNYNHRNNWILPANAIGPLLFWIFICSVIGYYVIFWSITILPSSQVLLKLKL